MAMEERVFVYTRNTFSQRVTPNISQLRIRILPALNDRLGLLMQYRCTKAVICFGGHFLATPYLNLFRES